MASGIIQVEKPTLSTSTRGRKLKAMLLFPPEWVPTAPYLALPSLTAVLRQHGHEVVQKDVNIEMYDYFFSDTFLIWVMARMATQRRALEAEELTDGLTEREAAQKACLEDAAGVDVLDLAERAQEAKRITRKEDFYDADKLEWALNTFREVMQYISAAYYPASLVFYPMESNLGYRPGVSKEVFACLDDEQVNVYRDVCRQLVLPAVSREAPDVVGVSIGTQMQLLAGLTFCKMIKEAFPLDSYSVPVRILPSLATRGCYWGRCPFCDHGQGYFDQYRGMPAHEVVRQIKALKEKYHVEHFLFADESYPPALFKKVVQLLVEQKVGIKWTTLIRFEETLQDPEIWKTAAQSGCCTLYYGMESANERVLNLMDKHVKQSVIENNLREAAKVGIWNHVMAFYGFPGETRGEAEETRQFLLDNKEHIHSVELFYFVAYRHTPMVRTPEKFGITIHKQEEYDLPLDYYYTLNEPGGVTCLEAMQLCEEFYQNDFAPWAVRVNAREHVFLYISQFGTNRLPQIYAKAAQTGASVSGLVTWPVARGDAEADSEQQMARMHSHAAP